MAAIVAFIFALANAAAALTGNDLSNAAVRSGGDDRRHDRAAAARGDRDVAALVLGHAGFEAILGIQIVFFSLFLLGAAKLLDALFCVVAIGLLGWLFWKLIRATASMQTPAGGERPPPL